MGYLDNAGLAHFWEKVQAALAGKQDKLVGSEGQTVVFNAEGDAVAREIPGESAREVYSAEEKEIGTWIDGKALYRRTFVGTTGAANAQHSIYATTNIGAAVHAYGFIVRSEKSMVFIPDPYVSIRYTWDSEAAANGICVWTSSSSLAGLPVFVTVLYTKANDALPL